jgi:hypothetical protein
MNNQGNEIITRYVREGAIITGDQRFRRGLTLMVERGSGIRIIGDVGDPELIRARHFHPTWQI